MACLGKKLVFKEKLTMYLINIFKTSPFHPLKELFKGDKICYRCHLVFVKFEVPECYIVAGKEKI